MKRFLVSLIILFCLSLSTVFATKLTFDRFMVNIPSNNIEEIYFITPRFIDITHSNKERYTYQYFDLSNVNDVGLCVKYLYLPSVLPSGTLSDNRKFTKQWSNNCKEKITNQNLLTVIEVPERRGILYVTQNKLGYYFLNSIYIEDGKLYHASLETTSGNDLEYRVRSLMYTISPR